MGRRLFVLMLLLALTAIAFQPAVAQTPAWRGEYFNNGTLNGAPVLVRTDNQISYNWGTGSPDVSVPSDDFSVRWSADVALTAGTYRFYAQADDNIRVIFNFGFRPVIDTFTNTAQISQLVTGDVVVPANGTYHIQIDYRELSNQAFAFLTYANLATTPNFPGFPGQAVPTLPPGSGTTPVTGATWTAQYYANNNLLGDPSAIFTESTPTHNWGTGAPLGSIPADNWSARWSSVQNLAGGAYVVNVRADDGVRVYINGQLLINEFHGASGLTYTSNITLGGGQNTFVVEFYDSTAEAFLDYNFSQVTSGGQFPTLQPTYASPTGATATVTAYRLNVRNAPDGINGAVITRISRFEQYSITGRTANSGWVQITVNGVPGWVTTRWVNISPLGVNIPVVSGNATAQSPSPVTGNAVTASPYSVVIRGGVGTQNARIGLLPTGASAPVIGRNSSNTWWQINYNGLVGWVSAQYAVISGTSNVGIIPITG